MRRYRLSGRAQSNAALLLMCVPGLAVLIVLRYVPMVGLILAFKRYVPGLGVFASPWAGLDNFDYLLNSGLARKITLNTLLMNSLFIVTTTVGALVLALLLNELRLRSRLLVDVYQSVLLFPFLLSYVLLSYIVFGFLNFDGGFMNQVLRAVGLGDVVWYQSPEWWPAVLTTVTFWRAAGFSTLIYLAGMIAINPEYYEASAVDGARRVRQAFTVTIPLISPLIIVTTLLAIGQIFYADFGLFYNVTLNSPALYPTTDVLDTYVFRALTLTGDVGLAAAAGFYQAVVGFILVLGANATVRKIAPEKALF